MQNDVTLRELADERCLDRTVPRKYIQRRGIALVWTRTEESGWQRTHALTAEDAEQVRLLRQQEGFTRSRTILTR